MTIASDYLLVSKNTQQIHFSQINTLIMSTLLHCVNTVTPKIYWSVTVLTCNGVDNSVEILNNNHNLFLVLSTNFETFKADI